MKKRPPSKVYISLGSNIGDRLLYLSQAVGLLRDKGLQILKFSNIYETDSWGFESPIRFLNAVVIVSTFKTESELLELIQQIEKHLGRYRDKMVKEYQSRTIDMDILFYDDVEMETPDIVIPHPRLTERMFVLQPLSDVCGLANLPVFERVVSEFIKECKDTSKPSYFCSSDTFEMLIGDIETVNDEL
ncbi:MAG: 2-amino-4-hydroxy-6-hydroxymethyldihydropteridine diphosphokinase [Bacteroidales bacterium]|nr:2-amino-4-hydroxy-6-hydroxymethyldihydropteridine diphosphokinase [Bacteroidales bacterium]